MWDMTEPMVSSGNGVVFVLSPQWDIRHVTEARLPEGRALGGSSDIILYRRIAWQAPLLYSDCTAPAEVKRHATPTDPLHLQEERL